MAEDFESNLLHECKAFPFSTGVGQNNVELGNLETFHNHFYRPQLLHFYINIYQIIGGVEGTHYIFDKIVYAKGVYTFDGVSESQTGPADERKVPLYPFCRITLSTTPPNLGFDFTFGGNNVVSAPTDVPYFDIVANTYNSLLTFQMQLDLGIIFAPGNFLAGSNVFAATILGSNVVVEQYDPSSPDTWIYGAMTLEETTGTGAYWSYEGTFDDSTGALLVSPNPTELIP